MRPAHCSHLISQTPFQQQDVYRNEAVFVQQVGGQGEVNQD